MAKPKDIEGIASRVVQTAHAQAQGLDDVVRQVSSISALVDESVEHAEATASVVAKANETSSRGTAAIRDLAAHGGQLSEIGELLDQSYKALKVIRTRSEVLELIAEQSRIVALNAGIEANRAGASGAVFATVAQMMRGLARRTADAAIDISDVVERQIDQVKRSRDVSLGYLAANEEATRHCSAAFDEVVESVADMSEALERSLEMSREHKSRCHEVQDAIQTQADDNAKEVAKVVDMLWGQAVRELSPAEVVENLGDLRVVDVRTKKERLTEFEPLPESVFVPLRRDFADKLGLAAGLDPASPTLFVCRNGSRGGRAARLAAGAGFRSVFILQGGLRALSELGGPLAQLPDTQPAVS